MMPQSSKGDRPNLHVGLWPPHPWRMAYMRGGLFFQGRLASVFGEDGLPSHLHLFLKPGYPSLQATWTCHSPHKCAILYAPISIAEVSESYFSVSIFPYFLISLYIYISIQSYKNIIVPTYKTTVLYLYFSFLLFLYLCFHICFYCSTSLFY